MAILSNINDKFRVDSAGAVYFGTSAGTNLQVLQSVGTTGSPVWVNVNDMQVTEDLHSIFGHIVMQTFCKSKNN